jgi:mRNA interferase MazF
MKQTVRRGELWAADLGPHSHGREPGGKERPALVIQTDALNWVDHSTTIVIPGTTRMEGLPPGDYFPLRVRVHETADLKHATDLMIDQVRAVSNDRLMFCYCTVQAHLLMQVEEALRFLIAR